MFLAGLACLYLSLRQDVTLVLDGEPRTVKTSAFNVSGVLRQAGIAVNSGDLVRPAPSVRFWDAPQIEVLHARPVTLHSGDDEQTITTSAVLAGNFLDDAGIKVYPGDQIHVDGAAAGADARLTPGDPHLVQFTPAVAVTIVEDDTTTTIYSSASTLGEALWEAGYRLQPADVLEPAASTAMTEGLSASLTRARPVVIESYGTQVSVSTAATTVGGALAAAGISLQGLDYSQPAEADLMPADRKIKIVRVQEKVALSLETVPFKTTYEMDPETELDQESVIQAGETGLIATRERVVLEDGQEVTRISDGTWTARNPKDGVNGQGMKVVVRKIEGTDIEYWRKITVYATSYSPCRVGGGRCSDHTAIGLPVKKGLAAVTLRWFRDMRLQTIYVPGYGNAVIGDTGGGIPGRYWIDLAFSDDDYESWHQWVTIYFLTPVPPYIPYILY